MSRLDNGTTLDWQPFSPNSSRTLFLIGANHPQVFSQYPGAKLIAR